MVAAGALSNAALHLARSDASAEHWRLATEWFEAAGAHADALTAAKWAALRQPTALSYFLLAVVTLGQHKWRYVPEPQRTGVLVALEHAVALPDCTPAIVDALADVYMSTGDVEACTTALTAGLARSPEATSLRARLLTHHRLHTRDDEAILRVATERPTFFAELTESFWWHGWDAAEALRDAGAPDLAVRALDHIAQDVPAAPCAILRAQCLLMLGRAEEATQDAKLAVGSLEGSTDRDLRVVACFTEASAHLAAKRTRAAANAVTVAAELAAEGDTLAYIYAATRAGDEHLRWLREDVIPTVCRYFLDDEGRTLLDEETLGWAAWLWRLVLVKQCSDDLTLIDRLGEDAAAMLGMDRLASTLFEEADASLYEELRPDLLQRLVRLGVATALAEYNRPWSGDDDSDQVHDFPVFPVRTKVGDEEAGLFLAADIEALPGLFRSLYQTSESPWLIATFLDSAYRTFVRNILFRRKAWGTVVELAEAMCSIRSSEESTYRFDQGYAQFQLGQSVFAVQAYETSLKLRECSAALNNLALLVEAEGRLGDARKLVERALAVAEPSEQEKFRNWSARLRQRLEDEAQRDLFLRTAPERWGQVKPPGRAVLAAVLVGGAFRNFDNLGELAGTDGTWAQRHYEKLIKLGMVVEDAAGLPSVNSHIRPLVERERTHAVATRYIRASDTIAYKPIFNSRNEYEFYHLAIQLFPNQLVFPNMGIQSIFQYERMQELLDSDTFGYYLRSSVDLCVVSTATYLPILAFEVDSDWHDGSGQQVRDSKKDRIFSTGGVPLLRLRRHGSPSAESIRQSFIDAVAQCDQLFDVKRRLDTRFAELELARFVAPAVQDASDTDLVTAEARSVEAILADDEDDDLPF